MQAKTSWQLSRTEEAESIAITLMQQLEDAIARPLPESRYGILIVRSPTGQQTVLKAGSSPLPNMPAGWVPTLPDQIQMALVEPQILSELAQLKQTMVSLGQSSRSAYEQMSQRYAEQLQQLAASHRQRKQQRDRQRLYDRSHLRGTALEKSLLALRQQSQQDGLERRRLKQIQGRSLEPLAQEVAEVDRQIRELKQQYKTRSQAWQALMQRVYLAALAGTESCLKLEAEHILLQEGLHNCPAAKLLHYARAHQLTPVALAEFRWSFPPANPVLDGKLIQISDRSFGLFYEASSDDCQMLAQLSTGDLAHFTSAIAPLSILYQDEHLIVVDKPAGMLSVPGRRYALQDSVLSRLRYQLPDCLFLAAVHRLDQATSGILAIAASPQSHQALSQHFAQRQVHKTYEAILSKPIRSVSGTIALPIWGDPKTRPRQTVDAQRGKPSRTEFKVILDSERPRIQFVPQTGRTHQLRVHAAHANGLNSPILGDRLYSDRKPNEQIKERLHLHATSLEFQHPVTGTPLRFNSAAPF